jgi:hypothetical protein
LYVTQTISFENKKVSESNRIIENIGYDSFMFDFYPSSTIICDMNYSTGLRCYEDTSLGNFHLGSQKPCTYTYSVPVYPDTIKVEKNYCESLNPSAIDTTIFYYRNDSLIIRNVKNEFCCPSELKAAIGKQYGIVKINVFNPGPDCLCECSYGYTVKIYKPEGDNLLIIINGESFNIKKSNLTTGVQKIDGNKLNIYPNPFSDFINIKTVNYIYEINIYDSYGRVIYKSQNIQDKIDLHDLSKGLYIVAIKYSNEVVTRKIIKE